MTETHRQHVRFAFEPWRVTESCFTPADYRLLEGIFALSNGYLGQRAGFEEGVRETESLRGHYVAGVFDAYPNSTMIPLRGRPSHPRRMVNVPDFLRTEILIGGERLDLEDCRLLEYERVLAMDRGVLHRRVRVQTPGGRMAVVEFERFLSRPRRHLAVSRIRVSPCEGSRVTFVTHVDADVQNADGRRHIVDVKPVALASASDWVRHGVTCRTSSTDIGIGIVACERAGVCAGEEGDGVPARAGVPAQDVDGCGDGSARRFVMEVAGGEVAELTRIVGVATTRDGDVEAEPVASLDGPLAAGMRLGYAELEAEQAAAWGKVWASIDIEVEDRSGTHELTQGLRYSVFQMMQNAPNGDPTVNIGAKGLSGEHYSGTYFWDTEVFMLPMFAFVDPEIATDLVRSRIHMLPGAQRKAAEMGLAGAAYPWMADADGDEACTLWQFNLLAVHVSAAVAWGVWFVYSVTGDLDPVLDGGLDVMVEVCRFWCSRAYLRPTDGKYVLNRVLGPDEYHQGVDNNFYTNVMARENLLKTCRMLSILEEERPNELAEAVARLALTPFEISRFKQVAEGMFIPYDERRGIHLQDEHFDDLEPFDLSSRPLDGALNAVWSYDRILRTRLLRQGDVLVAHALLGGAFDEEQLRRDFEYYEPITTHDSSLSFCHHAMLAARLGKADMAYRYYLRTARLDLDDLHGNSWMGVHAACLAGTWGCVVFGFGGVKWSSGELRIDPLLPVSWESYRYSVAWRGRRLRVEVLDGVVRLACDSGNVPLVVGGQPVMVTAEGVEVEVDTRPHEGGQGRGASRAGRPCGGV